MNTDWKVTGVIRNQYLNTALRASQNDNVFKTFRIIPQFSGPTGNTFIQQGGASYKEIKSIPHIYNNFKDFMKIDTIGMPNITTYGEYKCSPELLRFIESTSHINDIIGTNILNTVVELGSNFGGLTHCMLTQFPSIQTYWTIDFPEIQLLSTRVLNTLGWSSKIAINNPPNNPDLFIAEYSLSEQIWEQVIPYFQTITPKYIWLLTNFSVANHKTFKDELLKRYNIVYEKVVPSKPQDIMLGAILNSTKLNSSPMNLI